MTVWRLEISLNIYRYKQFRLSIYDFFFINNDHDDDDDYDDGDDDNDNDDDQNKNYHNKGNKLHKKMHFSFLLCYVAIIIALQEV